MFSYVRLIYRRIFLFSLSVAVNIYCYRALQVSKNISLKLFRVEKKLIDLLFLQVLKKKFN